MSAIDQFTEMKDVLGRLEKWSWCASNAFTCARFFSKDAGRTNEHSLNAQDLQLVSDVLFQSEYCGASLIWSFGDDAGRAIKAIVVGQLRKKLAELAERARAEAEEVLRLCDTAEQEPST